MEKRLKQQAREKLPGQHTFAGKIDRKKMYQFYSCGDIFAFPGINESLGMVYLEAQSCGLPVVGFENAGVPEAVQNSRTGILVPMYDSDLFADAISRFLASPDLRQKMGKTAQVYVREKHDIHKNYQELETRLYRLVEEAHGD